MAEGVSRQSAGRATPPARAIGIGATRRRRLPETRLRAFDTDVTRNATAHSVERLVADISKNVVREIALTARPSAVGSAMNGLSRVPRSQS
jgi:hypothetical protein